MRKMILWGLFVAAMVQSPAAALPQTPPRPETPHPITIDQIVHITSHEQLLRLATLRMATLCTLLEQATDEKSAREAAPLAERCYLEMELIGVRITMLTPPSDDERPRLGQMYDLFQQTRARIERECARLSKSPALLAPLRSVIDPLYLQAGSSSL